MPIRLLIVGHANTGKTSLIRTLLRSADFGEVADYAGTTRHVEEVSLTINGQEYLTLVDTPGLEDSIGLWDAYQGSKSGDSGLSKLTQLFDAPVFADEYSQEHKVIRQLSQCDLILYVIDARQAPLGKYQDELSLLALANKPIVPILNFSHGSDNKLNEWKSLLATRHHHTIIKYDTVAFYFEDEKRLYQALQSLLPDAYEEIQRLSEERQQQAEQRQELGLQQLLRLLIDCATYRLVSNDYPISRGKREFFQQHIREREQGYLNAILTLYDFHQADLQNSELAVQKEQWQHDLFAPDTLKKWGVNSATYATTGAAIGAGIDILSAGLSLGTATTIGALVGAGWQTGKTYKDALMTRLTGRCLIRIDHPTLLLLCMRGVAVLRHFHHRGHASQTPYQLPQGLEQETLTPPLQQELDRQLSKIGQHLNWYQQPIDYQHPTIRKLRQVLEQLLA